jgi:dipeptidyl aminopeptidase/acylaminoacyl peptidase
MRYALRFIVPLLSAALLAQGAPQTGQGPGAKHVEARLESAAKPKATGPVDEALKTIFATRRFEQVVISPDGKQLAWVETVVTKSGAATGDTVIYVSDRESPRPRRISAGAKDSLHHEGNVAWSPDGKHLAFLSDAASKGQLQLYVVSSAGAELRKLTSVAGFLDKPGWSPDGKTLAVLLTEGMLKAAGPLGAEEHPTGEIKDAFYEQRLALIDVVSGKLRQISPADTYIYEYDWAPDGKTFVVSAALGNGDNNWWIAELYTLDTVTGAMKSIYKPELQIASPVFSPDGHHVAVIEGLMSDAGLTGGDIQVIDLAGRGARNVTPQLQSSASAISWTADGKILFAQYVGGDSGIAMLDPVSLKITTIWQAPERISRGGWGPTLSAASDGKTLAFTRSSFGKPPEVWAGSAAEPKQITRRNGKIEKAWGEAKSLSWTNEGHQIQGWLMYPRSFDPSKKYPMIVYPHGGPSYAYLSDWPNEHNFAPALSASGYFVFMPNPRGSYGQGEAFTRGNVRDFGYGDLRDILAGIDAVKKDAPIDEQRIGLTGWSYGGYLTMWAVTQTDRFKAAVAGAGIADWQSYYGENSIDQWMIPFFGKSVYDDPDIYAHSAPITFIKKAKTPTLIVVGDSDGECPTPQSYEFWHALKTLGVETQLFVFEHEGHLFQSPKHQREVIERTVAWFDAHLH